jgi:hypothetical protein
MMGPLARLAAALRAEGGLLAAAVSEPASPAGLADGAGPARAYAVAAIREGYDCHHGGGRVVATDDRDLALLAGDRLYALGLAELAAAGDLVAVGVMAEVIAGSASARGAGDEPAAEAAWEQGLRELARPGEASPSADR